MLVPIVSSRTRPVMKIGHDQLKTGGCRTKELSVASGVTSVLTTGLYDRMTGYLNQSHDGTCIPCRSRACGFHLGFGLGGRRPASPNTGNLRPLLAYWRCLGRGPHAGRGPLPISGPAGQTVQRSSGRQPGALKLPVLRLAHSSSNAGLVGSALFSAKTPSYGGAG